MEFVKIIFKEAVREIQDFSLVLYGRSKVQILQVSLKTGTALSLQGHNQKYDEIQCKWFIYWQITRSQSHVSFPLDLGIARTLVLSGSFVQILIILTISEWSSEFS